MLLSKIEEILDNDAKDFVHHVGVRMARIINLTVSGPFIMGVVLNEHVKMEPEKKYALKIKAIGMIYEFEVNTDINTCKALTFSNPVYAEHCGFEIGNVGLLVEVVREPLVRQSADKLAACQ